MNSFATSRPATTFTRPMNGIFTRRRAAKYVSGCVRYGTTWGQPATDASSVVVPLLHIAASAARRIGSEDASTTGNGQRAGSIWTCGAALTTTCSFGLLDCSVLAVATNRKKGRGGRSPPLPAERQNHSRACE